MKAVLVGVAAVLAGGWALVMVGSAEAEERRPELSDKERAEATEFLLDCAGFLYAIADQGYQSPYLSRVSARDRGTAASAMASEVQSEGLGTMDWQGAMEYGEKEAKQLSLDWSDRLDWISADWTTQQNTWACINTKTFNRMYPCMKFRQRPADSLDYYLKKGAEWHQKEKG